MNLIKQCTSQLAPVFESDRGITISTSHVEYGEENPTSYVAIDNKIERPFITTVPVMFYRRVEEDSEIKRMVKLSCHILV